MRRIAFLLIACLVVMVPTRGSSEAADKNADKYAYFTGNMVRGSGDGATHGLAGDVLVCEQATLRPIAWFGAAKPDAEKSKFLYLMIFKTPAGFKGIRGLSVSVNGRGSSRDGVTGKMTVEMAKKKIEVAYQFPTDPKTHVVLKQSLTIGDQEIKDGDPRVFVVDLTGEKVTYTPVKVDLPKDAPDVSQERGDEWGEAVQRVVEQMKKDSPEVRKLLGAT
jgi:hypothetical protein